MFSSITEVKKSEKYLYFKELGYSEKEAVVFSLVNFTREHKIRKICEDFTEQNEKDFIDFVADRFFSEEFDCVHKEEIHQKPLPLTPVLGYQAVYPEYQNAVCRSASSVEHRVMEKISSCPAAPSLNTAIPSVSRSENHSFMDSVRSIIESVRTDSYEPIEEKYARRVIDSPTATFRPTYNTAAAGIILSNIRTGLRTSSSMVRTEEFLNYLKYDLKQPEYSKFEITKELKQDGDKTYLFLGVQGERVLPNRQNICLLLDVSGSMYDKKDSIILIIATVLSKMDPGDILSLVTYSGTDHVIIDGLILNENRNLDEILELLYGIIINGLTCGSAGINKAYEIIERNRIKDGVNRVIIITDGDLNFGIHDKDGLIGLIEKKRKTGAYLSAIGTGIHNLQDDKLEALAKNGNGNYFVVNGISDVKRTIRDHYEALVYPIARNVKAQMEFNPGKVLTWKLVGYENRMLNREDFRNNKVIAEPFGSGSYFIALFELTLNHGKEVTSSLKYQVIRPAASEELGTLTVRYEDDEDNTIREIEYIVEHDLPETGNIEKAIECAKIAERLRSNNIDEYIRMKARRILSDFK